MKHKALSYVWRLKVVSVVATFSYLLLSTALFYSVALHAAAPVIDGSASVQRTAQQQQELLERLEKVERMMKAQGMAEVFNRLDTLQREVQKLIGEVEVQSHQLETMKKRQRELYLDTDRRISRMEKGSGSVGSSSTPAAASQSSAKPATTPTTPPKVASRTTSSPMASGNITPNKINPTRPSKNPASVSGQRRPKSTANRGSKLERDAYERAFNLLKKGRYTMASASFRAFLDAYPNARYAGNAQYWLGEANYVQRKYSAAITEFKKVVEKFPNSPKLPDALLKMGFAYNELGQKKQAIKSLETILSKYGSSTAARLAKKRLISIKSSK